MERKEAMQVETRLLALVIKIKREKIETLNQTGWCETEREGGLREDDGGEM